MDRQPYITAVILAAGIGSRMGIDLTKQRVNIFGESVLKRSVKAFSCCDKISEIVIVCRVDELDWAEAEVRDIPKVNSIISGGKSRAESARIGFLSLSDRTEYVAIHDGARCLVTPEMISRVADAAITYGAATAGSFITDTVKHIDGGMVASTLPREALFAAQTPQIFEKKMYAQALNSSDNGKEITDDNMLIEAVGGKICPVDTGSQNIKITRAEDIPFAEYILTRRENVSEMRVGHGYDVHRLVEGRGLILGGVNIPHHKGLLGHSDADVLVHAIMDAILGACGLGDIGRHFPDTDDSYKGISSIILLRKVASLIKDHGYSVVNIDSTLVLQRPKVAAYINQMEKNIAEVLGLEENRVNVKATTEEGLGFTGSEEGATAYAVATVKK